MNREFLQPFHVFQGTFLHIVTEKSVESGLERRENTMTMQKKSSGTQGTVAKIPT